MSTVRLRIYLARALTRASAEYNASHELFLRSIEDKHPEWEVLGFYGLGASPTDGKVAEYDIIQVMKAHLVVAFTDVDSTGMGMESGIRFALGLPILFVAQAQWARTRMVTGPAELWPGHALFDRYNHVDEVAGMLIEAVKHFGIDTAQDSPRSLTVAPHFQDLYRTHVLDMPVSHWKS